MQKTNAIDSWRARSPDELVWAQFGNDYIAFHRPSGKTHFLNAASYHLICDILTDARELPAIVGEFIAEGDERDPSQFDDQMHAMLEHLRRLGLIDGV